MNNKLDYNYIYSLIRKQTNNEDYIQDVILHVFQKERAILTSNNNTSYINKLIYNKLNEIRRKEQRTKLETRTLTNIDNYIDNNQAQLIKDIEILNALDYNEQEIYKGLKQGKTIKELTLELNINNTKYYNALAKIRKEMED